ncbi:DedA family protein [Actinomadura syzygii]|uniref:DedA family protein n=2 Tax=Actinomadura syzygii TaxID=1427538 RepID=A0A5D0UEW6_9ACTN|nr:DedA family protein [Actinomadura syzygii]
MSWVSGLSGPVIYAVVAGLVFCEDALFFGFVLPGETAVVLGGALAAQQKVSVVPLAAIVVLAAISGDFVGYQIGRHAGQPILETRPLRRHHDRVDGARDLIRRRGGVAVFVGRFVAFFRAIMPALAGVSAMPSRVFLLYNAAGGLVWGVSFTLLGYFAGHAYARIEHVAGRISAIVIAGVVVLAVVIWRLRDHLHRKRDGNDRSGTDSR